MRKYYIDVPGFGQAYCSKKRYVVEMADDERIVGVNRDLFTTVVVANDESLHSTRGMMPQAVPVHKLRGGNNYLFNLSVFNWTKEYNCLYPSGDGGQGDVVLFSLDWRANSPVMARAKTLVTGRTNETPGVEDYEWAVLPLEDLDPEKTERESCLGVVFPD